MPRTVCLSHQSRTAASARRTTLSGAAARFAPAIELFVHRAQAVDADFRLTPQNQPTLAAICQRLDRLPLALELCAAQIDLSHLPNCWRTCKIVDSICWSRGARFAPAPAYVALRH